MAIGSMQSPGGLGEPQPMSEINVTPLVDVMLVLVVIFILTAPLLAASIRLELAPAQATRPIEGPQHVLLSLDRSGQVFVGDQPVGLESLSQRLTSLARQNPQLEVQLRADAAVPYGQVARLMGLVQESGLNRIGFVVEPQ